MVAFSEVRYLSSAGAMMKFSERYSFFLLAVMSMTSASKAQTAPNAVKLFSSAADVQALIAKAKSERKDNVPMVLEPILTLAPYTALLEYRTSVAPAALHENEAEFFYVISGSATMVTGGKLVQEIRRNASNPTATTTVIEGGTSRSVSKGDFIVVPQGMAHWFSAINETLVLMTLHVPRTEP